MIVTFLLCTIDTCSIYLEENVFIETVLLVAFLKNASLYLPVYCCYFILKYFPILLGEVDWETESHLVQAGPKFTLSPRDNLELLNFLPPPSRHKYTAPHSG